MRRLATTEDRLMFREVAGNDVVEKDENRQGLRTSMGSGLGDA